MKIIGKLFLALAAYFALFFGILSIVGCGDNASALFPDNFDANGNLVTCMDDDFLTAASENHWLPKTDVSQPGCQISYFCSEENSYCQPPTVQCPEYSIKKDNGDGTTSNVLLRICLEM